MNKPSIANHPINFQEAPLADRTYFAVCLPACLSYLQLLNVMVIPEEAPWRHQAAAAGALRPPAPPEGPSEARQRACEASWRSRGHAYATLGASRGLGGGSNASAAGPWVSLRWRGAAAYNRNWVAFFLPREPTKAEQSGAGKPLPSVGVGLTDTDTDADALSVSASGGGAATANAGVVGAGDLQGGALLSGASAAAARRLAGAQQRQQQQQQPRARDRGGAARLRTHSGGGVPVQGDQAEPGQQPQAGPSLLPRLRGGPMMVVYSFNPHVVLSCDRSSGHCSLAAATLNKCALAHSR